MIKIASPPHKKSFGSKDKYFSQRKTLQQLTIWDQPKFFDQFEDPQLLVKLSKVYLSFTNSTYHYFFTIKFFFSMNQVIWIILWHFEMKDPYFCIFPFDVNGILIPLKVLTFHTKQRQLFHKISKEVHKNSSWLSYAKRKFCLCNTWYIRS